MDYTLFAIIMLLSLCGFNNTVWFFKIFDFFRLQYALASISLALYSFFIEDYILLTLSVFLSILNLWRIRNYIPRLKFTFFRSIKNKKDIMSVNTYLKNDEPHKLETIIDTADPDVLLLMEITDRLELTLKNIFARYPYQLKAPVRDGFCICLLSKNKMDNAQITHHGVGDSPLLQADINVNDKNYSFFSAHPKPAFNKKWDNERHYYFRAIEKIIANSKYSPIIMGDFNSVPWESHFNKFLERTNTKSTLIHNGYKITWPVYFIPMGVPMDHIIIGNDVNFSDLKVGPSCGSDHYPIGIDLN